MLALDLIIASRVLLLTRLGRHQPDLSAELCYTPAELAVLDVKKAAAQDPASAKPTIGQANLLAARLAGFWGRAGTGRRGRKSWLRGCRNCRRWFGTMSNAPSRARRSQPGVSRRRGATHQSPLFTQQ